MLILLKTSSEGVIVAVRYRKGRLPRGEVGDDGQQMGDVLRALLLVDQFGGGSIARRTDDDAAAIRSRNGVGDISAIGGGRGRQRQRGSQSGAIVDVALGPFQTRMDGALLLLLLRMRCADH